MIIIRYKDGSEERFEEALEVRDKNDMGVSNDMIYLIRPNKIIAMINKDLIKEIKFEK